MSGYQYKKFQFFQTIRYLIFLGGMGLFFSVIFPFVQIYSRDFGLFFDYEEYMFFMMFMLIVASLADKRLEKRSRRRAQLGKAEKPKAKPAAKRKPKAQQPWPYTTLRIKKPYQADTPGTIIKRLPPQLRDLLLDPEK